MVVRVMMFVALTHPHPHKGVRVCGSPIHPSTASPPPLLRGEWVMVMVVMMMMMIVTVVALGGVSIGKHVMCVVVWWWWYGWSWDGVASGNLFLENLAF